jgi:Ca-activated chloride channel family protein
MNDPQFEAIPLRPAICSDAPLTLDVLVRITAPQPESQQVRPPINLALVIDRSGSMAEARKIEYAREAAVFAVEQLTPTDKVSITIYDSHVETIVPTTPAVDKPGLIRQIRGIRPNSATALFDGWKAGADQAVEGLIQSGLNRVLLLSDGLANQGLTDPNAIVAHVRQYAGRGISTTALGVGDHYNEDLMESIARGGQGNYYYIESPAQLTDIFQTEMHDLMAMTGHHVSLGVEPSPGVSVSDLLNDLDRTATGRYKLPNLVVSMPLNLVVRLSVEPRPYQGPCCGFRLAWNPPRDAPRQVRYLDLDLPSVPRSEWDLMPQHPDVVEQVALLMSARARREAAQAYERGDLAGSAQLLEAAICCTAAAPETAGTLEDREAIERLVTDFREGDAAKFLKRAKQQYWGRGRGKKLS